MSVQDCFTDFHIDFGGTSVWYHILRGAKVSSGINSQERHKFDLLNVGLGFCFIDILKHRTSQII